MATNLWTKYYLPYISHAVARSKYEAPTSCDTDPGIELGWEKKLEASDLFPGSVSSKITDEPLCLCKFLSQVVLNEPSVIIMELSTSKSLIKLELNLSSCNKNWRKQEAELSKLPGKQKLVIHEQVIATHILN